MSDRYDDDLTDAKKTALDEQIVERDSGDPNSDREYLQDLPPAGTADAPDQIAEGDAEEEELGDTDIAVEEGSALLDEGNEGDEGTGLLGEDDYGDGDDR